MNLNSTERLYLKKYSGHSARKDIILWPDTDVSLWPLHTCVCTHTYIIYACTHLGTEGVGSEPMVEVRHEMCCLGSGGQQGGLENRYSEASHPSQWVLTPLSHSDCHVGHMHVTRWLTIEQSLGSEGGTLGHTFPVDWTEPGSEAIHSATARAQPTWKLSLRKPCNHWTCQPQSYS